MSCQKHWITGVLLFTLRPIDVQFAQLPEALQAVRDEPVVGHCLRHASATGYVQLRSTASKRTLCEQPVLHPLFVMCGVLASLVIAPVAKAAVVIKVDDVDCEAGGQRCKARKRDLFRGIEGVTLVALRDGDGVLVVVGCDALVVLGFELTVDQAELGDGSADVEVKAISAHLDFLPEVIVDHVAQLARQCEVFEDHVGVAGGWYWYHGV